MLRSILRAILVVVSGGYGIGALAVSILTFVYIKDHRPPGDPWALEAAFGVGAFLVSLALLWFAWRMLYPPAPRPSADDVEASRPKAATSPGAILLILGLAALIAVAVWSWRL